jgi:acetylornithine deacetylase/succinyl-diaminopimelate desuccinylase-like protein
MDFDRIKATAEHYKADMTKFLRDLIAIPGESANEEGHIRRIAKEMEALGFDKVEIDPMGNVLGYMGTGKTLIAYDGHIDTVASAIAPTGPSTPTMATKTPRRSAAAAHPTRWAAS